MYIVIIYIIIYIYVHVNTIKHIYSCNATVKQKAIFTHFSEWIPPFLAAERRRSGLDREVRNHLDVFFLGPLDESIRFRCCFLGMVYISANIL